VACSQSSRARRVRADDKQQRKQTREGVGGGTGCLSLKHLIRHVVLTPPHDAVLMFKVLVLQTLYTLSDDQTEYQIRARLSFMRFVGLGLEDSVPDAKTIWLNREQPTRAGAIERLFARFDAELRAAGYIAMGGQIVDATIVQGRRPRLTAEEKATVRSGLVPKGWSKARTAHIDRGRARTAADDAVSRSAAIPHAGNPPSTASRPVLFEMRSSGSRPGSLSQERLRG
jgi:hypothetical protein